MNLQRREFMRLAGATAAASVIPGLAGAAASGVGPDIAPGDRVFITNEDSNTISVIDPMSNRLDTTINLTSFDEDPRAPFRFATGGVIPTHAAMVSKPLYHGCINAHGVAPNPDGTLLAVCGRGSSNVYLIDVVGKRVLGNAPNPLAGAATTAERLSGGVLLGREPHEPTFTRNGKELWVALRGENRIAILDVEKSLASLTGAGDPAIRSTLPTLEGPAQVWFSKDGELAFVVSQKAPKVDIFRVRTDASGFSTAARSTTLDLVMQDKHGFTPFQKISPDGHEMWLSHKLSDSVSVISMSDPRVLTTVRLGDLARPNHLEFVENAKGQVVYVSLARVDDGAAGKAPSSHIAIIDRSELLAKRRVVATFSSFGREAHGLWTNPAGNLLYVAHEQDELPNTPNAGQTVCSAFDVTNPFEPRFLAQIPLGSLKLPSGELRNKKSINLVYVRPGYRGQTA